MKDVHFVLDHRMAEQGLSPLVVDGEVTPLAFWNFPRDLVNRLARLNQLYDRQVDWRSPVPRPVPLSARDRREFNALLDLVCAELRAELSEGWKLVIDTPAIPPAPDQSNA